MTAPGGAVPLIRQATVDDAPAIAALHADSWRRHYRGSYPDAFLDGPVFENRLSVWVERLAVARSAAEKGAVAATATFVAELLVGEAVPPAGEDAAPGGASEVPGHLGGAARTVLPPGFAHVVFDDDSVWGALVDNLHVRHDVKGGGIGTMLLGRVAAEVLVERPGSGVFLWVLRDNVAAQAFYRARGGRFEDMKRTGPPGGGVELEALRCTWPDPGALVMAVPNA